MTSSPSPDFARQNILTAAQKILAGKKVSGTRMREIARAAGISQGTLHYYYPSKTGLFLAVLDEMQAFFDTRQKQLFSGDLDAIEKIRLFSEQQKNLLKQMPQIEEVYLDFWGHAMVDARVREKILTMYASWREDIRQAVEHGVATGEFDPERAARAPELYVALLEGTALQYLPAKAQMDLEAIFQAINTLMIAWLRGDSAVLPEEGGETSLQKEASPRRRAYPSDLAEAEWQTVAPRLHPPRAGGRPRSTDLREIINALRYIADCGCTWRMLPHDFPGWQTVYAYYRLWQSDGTLEQIGSVLGADFSKSGQEP